MHNVYYYVDISQQIYSKVIMIRNSNGRRKYLTMRERSEFLRIAKATPVDVHTFCWTLASTGCRLSEALQLTHGQIDYSERVVVFRSLKKREPNVYRSVPVQNELLTLIKANRNTQSQNLEARLWPWSRSTGWARVKEVMEEAGIRGVHATPKGLRHGFGVAGTQKEIPLNMIQKWLGHSDIQMTAIYTDAVGDEERKLAQRMWC